MEITKRQLRNCAEAFLDFIEQQGITSLEILRYKSGRHEVRDRRYHFISVDEKGLMARYYVPSAGVVIQAGTYSEVDGHSHIKIKVNEMIEGYTTFPTMPGRDDGNISQVKEFNTCDIKVIRKELEALAKVG